MLFFLGAEALVLYQFRLYRNDLTAKARSTRSKRRESLRQDDEKRILYYYLRVKKMMLFFLGAEAIYQS
jgi:hypothetical protein